ncbi:MAG: hypothetical protein ABIQ11_09240, partial [Saprospiraceae bacterium]
THFRYYFCYLLVKTATDQLISMIRYLFPLLLILISISDLAAQVQGIIRHQRQTIERLEVISITWKAADEVAWKNENKDRLEVMAVKTGIQSKSLLHSEGTSDVIFDIGNSGQIEVLFTFELRVPGEEIILKDKLSGEILLSLSASDQPKILTPEFDPAQTELLWKGDKSVFEISTVYVHEQQSGRNRGIGFGTALTCHPNAACKEDSMMRLISNSAVRIRMVNEEGIGWCSGSFVNNTLNDKSPLVLTANHCTFEYTPIYDLWRFDLQYKSDSCPNPSSEPTVLSLTGCALKAKGQASDFFLVLLDDNVPAGQQVTFAGWNRDDVATPDTTYLVHHPNADIRKLSTCINKATIHPSQIGWSEGYTTPAHHHFKFKFTEGGHQAGSSGGPVFNQVGLIVAGLHGGSSGCEVDNSAYAGRLSKSWNLGANSSERLRDWLDPLNLNVVEWPSIENASAADLASINGIIQESKGRPLKNVEIEVTGSVHEFLSTDDQGKFILSSVSRSGTYTIKPSKNTVPLNGVNVLDLVAIQKHLLARDTLDFSWQHIAADATNNQSVNVGDIILLLKLLLNKITYLPTSPSWRFDPPQFIINTFPPGENIDIQFKAVKIGDVNGTADPNQ